MTLHAQLHEIADRLEVAETARNAVLLELRALVAQHPVSWDPTEPNADDFAAEATDKPALGSARAGGEAAATPLAPSAPPDAPGQARQDGAKVDGRRARAAVAPPQRPPSAPTGTPAPATDAAGSDQPKEEGDAGGAVAPEAVAHDGSAFPSSSPIESPQAAPIAQGATYPCPDCEKVLTSNSNWWRHRRSAHGSEPAPDPQPIDGRRGDWTCPCGQRFTWAAAFKRHQRSCLVYLEAATAPDVTADPLPVQPPAPKRPPWEPKPVAKADSVIKNGRERWLCARCTEQFNTPEKRDEHQRFHPPVPVVAGPVGRGSRSVADRVATGGGSLR